MVWCHPGTLLLTDNESQWAIRNNCNTHGYCMSVLILDNIWIFLRVQCTCFFVLEKRMIRKVSPGSFLYYCFSCRREKPTYPPNSVLWFVFVCLFVCLFVLYEGQAIKIQNKMRMCTHKHAYAPHTRTHKQKLNKYMYIIIYTYNAKKNWISLSLSLSLIINCWYTIPHWCMCYSLITFNFTYVMCML